MDSPLEVIKFTTTTTATATADSTTSSQESPVTNFIRNLSPIKNIRCANFAQAYLSLYSPTQVFTSPHTSSHRETSFPQRPQCFSLLLVETTQYDYESNKYDNGLDDSTETTSCLSSGLINQKDMDTKNSLPGHSNSSSGDVDEYLVDPVEVDHANSAYSASSKLEQSDGLLPSTESKNDLMSDGNDAWKEVDAPLPFKEQFGEDFPGKKFGVEAVKIVEGQKFGESLSIEYPVIESALSLDNISKEQQFEISGVQNVGGSNQDKFDRPSQLLPEQKQIVLTLEDHGGSARASTGGPAENAMHHVNEASQNQHSISRRCLQFGEAQPKSTLSSISSFNLQNNVTSTRQPLSAMQLESSEASHVDSSTTSSKRLLVSLSQPMSTMVPPRHRGNVPFAISKPSGIGLHLNSIVNNVPVGYSAIVRIKSADNSMGGLGMRSASGASCFFPENIKSCSGSSSLVEKVSDINEDMMFRSEASIAAGSPPTEALHPMKPLKTLPPVEHNATPLSKMKVNVEHAHNFEEIKQPSPSKKRKKSSSTLDGDGCKCCNCKKTKCLKLYCDCFAAGIYCAEPCSCQGCFNRPEYEETVLETRQQIKSRNPLAFSPKIVQRVTEFPSNTAEEGNWSTPSSARHKKGCNCKKSMCLKKYCECYQANVGCSSGCRCEGCKNVYGKKEEYGLSEEMMINRGTEERLAETFDGRLEVVATEQDFLLAELYDSHHRTPLTPSFRGSKYLPSSESDLTILSSYAKPVRSVQNSDSNDIFLETSKGIIDVNSYGQETDYNSSQMGDRFSPRCDSLVDMSNLTPLSNPSMVMSSASSKTMDWTNASRFQPGTGSSCYPSDGSLRWRCSPISPMTQLRGTKDHERVDTDSRHYDILEDDTPDDTYDIFLETSKGILDVNSYGQETDYNSSQMGDRFSPRCDSLVDMSKSNLTPLPNPSMAMSSASSKTMDWTNASRLQPGTGSSCYPSDGSLRWRCSPISPMTQLCGAKDHERVDTDSRYYDILEDDTPEILKDASSPNKSVKVSSPNQKRVSLPHAHMQELGSSSSGGGLKSRRKFILQAMPSFPILTPCIDSKGSTNQKESDV